MSDEPRRPESQNELEGPSTYEPPQAEELPDSDTVATADAGPASTVQVDSQLSDRDAKRDFADVDREAVLAAVAGLPVSSWSYRADDPRVRHVGPMAQDFAAAFGVGEDDRHIHPVDASGVALAAIQALAERLAQAEARIAELGAERAPAAV
jgi:hypothetical protein